MKSFNINNVKLLVDDKLKVHEIVVNHNAVTSVIFHHPDGHVELDDYHTDRDNSVVAELSLRGRATVAEMKLLHTSGEFVCVLDVKQKQHLIFYVLTFVPKSLFGLKDKDYE